VGTLLGFFVGKNEGILVGKAVIGIRVGNSVGNSEGAEGLLVGRIVGGDEIVGLKLGAKVG
jgi:hypothetical protein